MQLQFLGTGSAFTMNNWQSNMILKGKDHKLLIDCGSDIRWALREQGLSYLDIDQVYISHLHADHAGGLEYLGFQRYFDPRCDKPTLFISESIVDDLWNHTLSGGMGSIQGLKANLNTYFDVYPIERNGSFCFGGTKVDDSEDIELQLVQTVHIMDGFSIVPSFGLMFKTNGKTYYITTDTQHCPEQIKDFYFMADVVFHDCEITPYVSGVHANFLQLVTLPEYYRKKMWLYHYQDLEKPDAKINGFQGFVEKGQIFEL